MSAVLKITCNSCGREISITEDFLGKDIPCPGCGKNMRVQPKAILAGPAAELPADYVRRLSNGAMVVFGSNALETVTEIQKRGHARDGLIVASAEAEHLALPDTLMLWAMMIFAHPIHGTQGRAPSREDLARWKDALIQDVAFATGEEPMPKIEIIGDRETPNLLLQMIWKMPESGPWNGVRSGQLKRVAMALDAARAAIAGGQPAAAAGPALPERAMIHGGGSRVNGVGISPDGRTACSCGEDGVTRLWDLESGKEIKSFPGVGKPISSVALLGNGQRVAWVDAYSLTVRDSVRGDLVFQEYGRCDQFSATGDGRFMVTANEAGSSTLYDLEKRFAVGCLGDPYQTHDGGPVRAVALSPDGALALTAGLREVKLWRIDTFKTSNCLRKMHWRYEIGKVLHCFETYHMLGIKRMAFLPGRGHAVALGHSNRPCLIDLQTFNADGTFSYHLLSKWNDFAFSADGRRVAVAHALEERPAVSVLHTRDWTVIRTCAGHTGPVTSVAISADGSRVVSGSADGTVRNWSV